MTAAQIRFDDGAAYERMMGLWSRSVGEVFLEWLAPASALRWIDVGCGNGAFTELLVERCAPSEVEGIDPSEPQIAFARTRPAGRVAKFQQGDGMALPFSAGSFDAAVMALVIFFVPDPAKGLAEMVRVVKPGGMVAAYAWDILGGGLPAEPIAAEMRAMGVSPLLPPSAPVSQMHGLLELWRGAGLDAVVTQEITVQRTFADFEEFWGASLLGGGVGQIVASMPSQDAELLKARVRARLPLDQGGHLTQSARANAIKGRVPR
jgi:SAM-dependent methyltransferase